MWSRTQLRQLGYTWAQERTMISGKLKSIRHFNLFILMEVYFEYKLEIVLHVFL